MKEKNTGTNFKRFQVLSIFIMEKKRALRMFFINRKMFSNQKPSP